MNPTQQLDRLSNEIDASHQDGASIKLARL